MRLLEERIKKDGQVLGEDVLKVDNFLNHQVDPELMAAMGEEFKRLFEGAPITKILTVESSGIAPAVFSGLAFHVPVVFARKHKSLTLQDNMYSATVYSYTKKVNNHISISKKFLNENDRVLVIDDFLANGQAVEGLLEIIDQAGAQLEGSALSSKKHSKRSRVIRPTRHSR